MDGHEDEVWRRIYSALGSVINNSRNLKFIGLIPLTLNEKVEILSIFVWNLYTSQEDDSNCL